MPLHNDTEEALDHIDAAVFTGDSLFDKDNMARFEYFIARWQKEITSIKKVVAEAEHLSDTVDDN